MAVGDIYKTAVVGEYDGQTVINTAHYVVTVDDGPNPTTTRDLAVGLLGRVGPILSFVLNAGWTLTRVEAQRVFPTLGGREDAIPLIPVVGQTAGDGLPGTVALVITKRTTQPGRNRRGRLYLPAISEADTTEGRLNLVSVAQFQNAVNNTWLTPAFTVGAGGQAELCVYSPASLPNFWPVSSLRVNVILGNQRRRRIGVGI